MARKSRKTPEKQLTKTNQKTYSVGVYVRLSLLNNNMEDDSSIQNQKNIILNYIKNNEQFKLIEIYEDNNFSGTNFNRTAFQKLIEDVQSGKINCIIVKDLSRFGRNYIECGNYLEKIFPYIGVRFIAINDNYDSENMNSSEILMMHLKNIINQLYAQDIGKKVSTAIRAKQKRGEYVGSFPNYGYKKDEKNKNKLVINEETAPIVKMIYDLKLQGLGYVQIASKLNDQNILSPYAYLHTKGYFKTDKYKDLKWTPLAVKRICTNQVYIGNIAEKKSNVYGDKAKDLDMEKFIVVKNMHEPIVSEKVFYKVQQVTENIAKTFKQKYDIKTTENIFKGLVKCGNCGKNMYRFKHCVKNKNGKINVSYDFKCKEIYKSKCKVGSTNEETLKRIVFNQLKTQIQLVLDLQDLIVKNDKFVSYEEHLLKNTLQNLHSEITKIKNFQKTIYEDYCTGLLDEEDYLFTKANYIEKENELNLQKENIQNKLFDLKNTLNKENEYIKQFLKFKNYKFLTRELLQTLIEKIVIHNDKSIEIFFKYENEYKRILNEIERVSKNAV